MRPKPGATEAVTGGRSSRAAAARSGPIRYVCMPGSPYTGSTLLGLLLDHHPGCVSIGAATGLTERIDLEAYRCSCGRGFTACPFWAGLARRTEELRHPVTVFQTGYWNTHVRISRRRWLNGVLIRSLGSATLTRIRDGAVARVGPVRAAVEEAGWATWSLARAALDATGKDVFVDTARDHQRPRYLRSHPGLDLRVIHLVRDPRGNTASIMKHTGADVATAARRWRHYNAEADRLRRWFPPASWMRLRYEDLCADPQGTLDRVGRFIGVAPAPIPDRLLAADRHLIGNSMRLRGVEAIRRDDGWRQTLDDAALRCVAGITGPLARSLGYRWPEQA